jgi:glyoxylase-like metal-dependent hydrolase (beta-lactamase superfamily II)
VALRKPPHWATGLQEVAPDTYAYLQFDGTWGISNAGFLAGDDGLLVIDATMVASMAESFINQIRRVSDKPFRHLINTHSHPDHVGGNRLFAGAEIVSHRVCREEMARAARPASGGPPPALAAITRTPAMERMFEMVAQDPARHIPLPSLTYEDTLTLHYGAVEIQLLYYGPAHTFGDTLVYFPESKVLFAGDIAFFYSMPLAASGKIGSWLRVIDRVKELDVDLIVPGHGPAGDKDVLNEEREYFEYVMEQTRTCLERGVPAERAAKEIDPGAYGDWLDSERMVANVLVAYRELRGEI